ncbi:ANTAR domain-containing protein [Saccharomonospora sp. NPDC046836]|uniref:ANTAR domain-containing protein n=1 Tax=Saccharomonospora sp. NPDC046836 TaxID=3156921 RepID=UPI0033DE5392
MAHTSDTPGSGPPDDIGLRNELDGLRRALRSRATIEQAVGVLVVSHRCSPQEAFRLLIGLSQQHNIKLHRIAQALLQLAERVEHAAIEPMLDRAVASGSVTPDGTPPGPAPEPDQSVLDRARMLVDAKGDNEIRANLVALYDVLVDRGWIPPYEVLSSLRARA